MVVINGFKRWRTGVGKADFIYLLVRSGPPEMRKHNLSFVIVPTDARSITLTALEKMGTKGVPTNDVALDDVQIPFDNVVGGEQGWNNGSAILAGPALEAEKLQVPALALGIAEAWQHSQNRKQGASEYVPSRPFATSLRSH